MHKVNMARLVIYGSWGFFYIYGQVYIIPFNLPFTDPWYLHTSQHYDNWILHQLGFRLLGLQHLSLCKWLKNWATLKTIILFL